MKNMQISFSKIFRTAIMVVFFGLVLGFSSVPFSKAEAQSSMVTGSIIATPDTIDRGGSTQIKWNSFNATEVIITPDIGSVGPSGSRSVSPNQTTTYTMTMRNSGDSGSISATVYVRDVQQNNPTVNLTADDNTLNSGESTTLRWTSANATSCTASGAWSGSKNLNGSEGTGSLTSTRTYSITCRNDAGNSAFDSETITVSGVQGNGPTVNITADDTRINEGDETTIRWSSTNADTCTASGGRNGWSGSRNRSGEFDTGDLFNDTTYTIICTNQFGSATDSETVRVDEDDNDGDRPTVNIYANPGTVNYNGSSIITWTSRDADRCRSTGGTSGWPSSSRGRSGTFYANSLTSDTTFSITCTNDEGSASDSVTVRVNNFVNNTQPIVNLYADSTNLSYGGTTFVRWSTINATSCYASGGSTGWAGSKSIGPGSFYTGSLYSGRTYTLTCTNNAGSATDSVTVNVRGRTTVVTQRPTPTSLVLITSSIDRNQPILPTLDNTRPHVGDEINYTVTYQNIGTAAIRNLTLRLDLPYEVDYMFSNPSSPTRSGNTLIFSLGTLQANGTGTVTVRVRVREDAAPGALLNFPAVLSYTDPAGFPQSVSANVSAQVWSGPEQPTIIDEKTVVPLGANIFGAGFWPTSLFGWLLFLILVLILVLLAKSLFAGTAPVLLPRKTVTTTVEQH